MADLTLRLVKGQELTFGELDANFLSLDSDIVSLVDRVDSLSASGLTGGASLTISVSAPSVPEQGDMWLSTDSDVVYVWDGTVWFEFPQGGSFQSLDSADVFELIDSSYISGVSGEHWDSAKSIQLLDEKGVQNIVPLADSTYDLGTPSLRWKDLHLSGNTIHLGTMDIKSGAGGVYVNDKRLAYDDSSLDSGQVVGIIDSHVDSAYIKFLADSAYVQSAADSNYLKFIVDSAYIRTAATYGDSDVTVHLDSFDGHIIPMDGETYDLGTNLRRWRNIYVKDLFVSPATIHFSDSAETPQSTLSLDSSGEFKLSSPSGTGFIATSTTGTAFDSNTILSIIDSAYVQSRQVDIDTVRDSAFITNIIDAAYIQARQVDEDTVRDSAFVSGIVDSAYIQARQIVGGSPWDSAKTTSIIDSAYIQARQVDVDTVRDSAFITGLVDERIDSTQFLATTATTTDVSEGDNLYYTTARHDSDTLAQVDSAYVQQRVRGPEMIAGGRFTTSSTFNHNDSSVHQLFGIWGENAAPGGGDGIARTGTGKYRMRFDSATANRVTDGNDYTVMLTYDYNTDDPTASSRTLTVLSQNSADFDVVVERSDGGGNEDYANGVAKINFQVWLY